MNLTTARKQEIPNDVYRVRILDALRAAPDGLTAMALYPLTGRRHKTASALDGLLAPLIASGQVTVTARRGPGRPGRVYRAAATQAAAQPEALA